MQATKAEELKISTFRNVLRMWPSPASFYAAAMTLISAVAVNVALTWSFFDHRAEAWVGYGVAATGIFFLIMMALLVPTVRKMPVASPKEPKPQHNKNWKQRFKSVVLG